MEQKDKSRKLDESREPRKPYVSPKVREFGNIRDITKTPGNNGMSDGLGSFTSP